jgi:glycosyltransferase involved in cell wall biosynthesis
MNLAEYELDPAAPAGGAAACAIIPSYRAADSVCDVVLAVLDHVALVIVVDDACPQGSGERVREAFAGDPRVIVAMRPVNGGVGAAMKTGIALALDAGARYIVKVDADNQMDPALIPSIISMFEENNDVVFVKGNRFASARGLSAMPKVRLFGNAALSIMAKFSTGYWNVLDPTNGYIAFRADFLSTVRWREFANSYFFELSVLCELGLQQAQIAELEMPAQYGTHPSSLSITRVIFEFPPKLLAALLRRVFLQYFVFDFNLCTLFILFAVALISVGVTLAGIEYVQSQMTQIPRTTGTVMLAVLPLLIGIQLMISALMYDVQSSRIVIRSAGTRSRSRRARIVTHI